MPTTSAGPEAAHESASKVTDGAVFVDHTGTRRRVWGVFGVAVSILAALYLALLLAAVLTSTGPGSAS